MKPYAGLQYASDGGTSSRLASTIDAHAYGAEVGVASNSVNLNVSYNNMPFEANTYKSGGIASPYTYADTDPLFTTSAGSGLVDKGSGHAYKLGATVWSPDRRARLIASRAELFLYASAGKSATDVLVTNLDVTFFLSKPPKGESGKGFSLRNRWIDVDTPGAHLPLSTTGRSSNTTFDPQALDMGGESMNIKRITPEAIACASALAMVAAMFGSVRAAGHVTVTVFAAASLHNAFAAVGQAFERTHPGMSVRFNFDGSQILEAQLAHGARADIYASADRRSMAKAAAGNLVDTPVPFARNHLVVVASTRSRVRALSDLTRPGMKIDLCADVVPCGRYARIALNRLSGVEGLGPAYGDKVLKNVVSNEQDVEAVVQKIVLGEADAGIVYATDVSAEAAPKMRAIEIPKSGQVEAVYPIAIVKDSTQTESARAFVDFVFSGAGRRILKSYGFGAPPASK
ncbi:MAG: molybdate ABC transporter substrate-binding protein [Candidatus Eremiobacteraeota bacterium]|nr:molybdate ABC transporter substrate-binding protein [Candidatus Eremiobacteraeota bacterium]MBC5828321.1 molybdate ABC transporter substrate-binding protein [Candidatus Eremiobacteraeota bacterium]